MEKPTRIHVAQVEWFQQRVEVGGEGVVVVADADLAIGRTRDGRSC